MPWRTQAKSVACSWYKFRWWNSTTAVAFTSNIDMGISPNQLRKKAKHPTMNRSTGKRLKAGFNKTSYQKAKHDIFLLQETHLSEGKLSDRVFLHRGERQGCWLSPLLYVLVSEVLSRQIRNCKKMKCYRLPGASGLQFKIS